MMRLLMVLIFAVSLSAQAEEVATTPESAASVENTEGAVVKADEKAIDNRKESEIPLNLEAKKNAGAEGSSFFRILLSLSVLGVVGTGAYIFLRKYSVPKALKHQTQIKVLQQHYLGPKKSLAIVRVAGESILIGVTDHNISMIKSLSLLDDEVPEETPMNFESTMENFDDEEAPAKPTKMKKTAATDLDADEEFAISGIKDIVSKRLKGMRSFQ